MAIDTVRAELGERSYDILIGEGLLEAAGRHIAPHLARPFAAIVTDENVAASQLEGFTAALKAEGIASTAIVLPPGETTKSFASLAPLCDRLLSAGIERRDRVIALGGGVIGDLTGFAAAILRRGVGFIQVPTSLLGQVDSSVGGKTGINSALGKNLIGAFHQPLLVLADTEVLSTLPDRELRAGYAEVAKYGLLGDAGFFEWLEANYEKILAREPQALRHAVATSCRMKARIVAEDETETAKRALLNLGHTFGHALEAAAGYSQRLLHGEAVAIGMAQAFRFSEARRLCRQGTASRVVDHLEAAGLPTSPTRIPGGLPSAPELLKIMRQDKKAVGGRLTFILARGVGEAFIAKDVNEAELSAFLEAESARP